MANRERRVVAIARSGHVQVRTEPVPDLTQGCLLVRVFRSLISAGTELGAWVGARRPDEPEPPWRAFGYQNAGEVLEVGERCEGFRVGDRVACMGAGYALHTDIAVAPYRLSTLLPNDVTFEEGAFAALAPTAMHAARRGDIAFGEDVAIMGLGLVGQLTAQVCRAAGANVFAFDPLPLRVERARQCSIEKAVTHTGDEAVKYVLSATNERGLDAAFICFGGEATDALRTVKTMMQEAPDTHRMGRVVIVGGAQITHRFGADLGNLDLRSAARTGPGYHDPDYERGKDYPNALVRWTTQAHLKLFVNWTQKGQLSLKPLITGRFRMEEAATACEALMSAPGEHVGVILEYD